jgi:hypothetical protein
METTADKVEVPYPEKTATWHPTEDTIAFLETHYSGDIVSNPLEEWDAMGTIYSFSRRHHNFLDLELASLGPEALDEHFEDGWVPLGYFEHGLCDWHITGEIPPGTAGDYRWDGVRFAGVWVPDEELMAYIDPLEGQERTDKMREHARQACIIYTQWCNGEVYGYAFEVHRYRHPYDRPSDYRFDEPLYEDSCYGFFGWDDFEEAVQEAVAAYQKGEADG